MKTIIKAIPNAITSCNLFCGAMATYFASISRMDVALVLIILAAVFDFLDGTAARLLKAYSALGVQLDSLADMVSFGLAPSMAMFTLMIHKSEGLGSDVTVTPLWAYAAFFLAVFSALRLAKFNIDETQKSEFHGLPTPAMSLFMFSYAWAVTNYFTGMPLWVHLVLVAIFSALMVSPIVMFSLKFKNLSLKDNIVRYVFILFAVAVFVMIKEMAFAVIIIGYILTSCVIDVFAACRK